MGEDIIPSPVPIGTHLQPSIPYLQCIGHGLIRDHWRYFLAGYNPSYGSTNLEDVSELGVATIPLPASAIALEAVSTDDADDLTGTGVQKIRVHGLDTNWLEQTEEVELDGTTAVDLANTYRRVHLVYATQIGSGGKAAGTIKIQADGGGTEYIRISQDKCRSLSAIWTVPDGKKAFVTSWYAGVSDVQKFSVGYLKATCDPATRELLSGCFLEHALHVGKDVSTPFKLDMPMIFPARCDIKIAVRAKATGDAEASAVVEIFYEDE